MNRPPEEQTPSTEVKEFALKTFLTKLKKRHIIETFAGFIAGGWLCLEFVDRILVAHYHINEKWLDVAFFTLLGALICVILWRWFSGAEKRPGNVKIEVLLAPLIIFLTIAIDFNLILQIVGIEGKKLVIGAVALCLGIAWIIFKSLQWAAIPRSLSPELSKRAEAMWPSAEPKVISPDKSIVVLPFKNISPEEGQEYFCDGMTEEIITDLSRIHDLLIISRSSAMTLKGSPKTVRDIAKELNVRYALEGSVRKAGNNLRITAQLIDALSDIYLWADKFSGTLDDVFDIQEKVSRAIVDGLKLQLTPAETQKMTERPIKDLRAYECYLRARQEIWRFREDALERALQLLIKGLEIVGDNELLFAAMGAINWQYINAGISGDTRFFQESEEYISKIFELNPDSVYGYFLRGSILHNQGKLHDAIRDLKKALAIGPHNADVILELSRVLAGCGQRRAAEQLIHKLLEIDPLTPINYCMPGYLRVLDGQFEAAVEHYQRMYMMDPQNPMARWFYAWALAYNRRFEEAYNLINQIAQDLPNTNLAAISSFLKYALQQRQKEALQTITPELEKTAKWGEFLAREMAHGYALINRKEEALDWLETSVNHGFIHYPFLSRYDPWLANIRGEPRFQKLMERVKYEWEHFEV